MTATTETPTETTQTTAIDNIPIETDPELLPEEKSVTINITGTDDYAHVFSDKRTVTKSLLKHDHFEPARVRVALSDETVTTVDFREIPEETTAIYGVWGTLPIGCLSVKHKPRTHDYLSNVVKTAGVDPTVFE